MNLFPPTSAECDLTFWLSAPRRDVVRIAAGTRVSTHRTELEEPVTFSTKELLIRPCHVTALASHTADAGEVSHAGELDRREMINLFSVKPQTDDAFLIGLSNPVPSCIVSLVLDCRIEGIGVDPLQPPIAWEAWTGARWVACERERDDTRGLNQPGEIVLHVPAGHDRSLVAG